MKLHMSLFFLSLILAKNQIKAMTAFYNYSACGPAGAACCVSTENTYSSPIIWAAIKRLSICKNWEPYLIQISPLWGHLSVCHGTASSRAAIFRPLHGSLILTTYMSASVISPPIKTLMLRIVTGDESWISGFHPETKQLFLQEEVCSVQ